MSEPTKPPISPIEIEQAITALLCAVVTLRIETTEKGRPVAAVIEDAGKSLIGMLPDGNRFRRVVQEFIEEAKASIH